MEYKVLVNKRATSDAEKAFHFYAIEKTSPKTALDFYHSLDNALESFKTFPHYQKRSGFHAYPMKKFPYIIFLDINESAKTVKVLRIFNTYQDTKKYPKA